MNGPLLASAALFDQQVLGYAARVFCMAVSLGLFAFVQESKPARAATGESARVPIFHDHFDSGSLDSSKWMIENRPANGTIQGHKGFFTPENVDFSPGMLRLKLVQSTTADGIVSYGASIQSKEKFSYGQYQFVMRMASTSATPSGRGSELSGSVSSAFIFVNNAETELDIEYLGDRAGLLHLSNWRNTEPSQHPSGGFEGFNDIRQYEKIPFRGAADAFHMYVIEWKPSVVKWYIDGKQVASHDTDVPEAPAYIKLNLWGTNRKEWGGVATPGTARYMYIRNVSFSPME